MVKIKGQFDVSLSIPIDVTPNLSTFSTEPCSLVIHGSTVTILPLKITDVVSYPDGEFNPPELTEIRVWINRDVNLDLGQEESLILTRDEEKVFEEILIEACDRFISIIRRKTNQWDLDTKHPIHAYSYEYWLDDKRLTTSFALEPGSKRIPEYAHGRILLRTGDFQEELSQEIWNEAATEIQGPVPFFLYEELLYDAKTFRSHLRYDSSVLCAAIASELMLEEACTALLKSKGGLNEKQCGTIIGKLRNPQLLELVHELDPNLSIKEKDIRKLFEIRNKIAHGRIRTVTAKESNFAISTAEQLKRDLMGCIQL
jgi:hypothetical protein